MSTIIGRCCECDTFIYDENKEEKKWFEDSGMCMECVSKTFERDFAAIEAQKRAEIAHDVYTDMMDTIYKIAGVSPDQRKRWTNERD